MNNSDNPQAEVQTKMQLLMQMFEMQKNVSSFMISAQVAKHSGDFLKAIDDYEKQIEFGKKHLDLALLHNEHYPPPIEIEPIVQVLVDAMLMLADTLQSFGEMGKANGYRDEAITFSENYLSLIARLDVKRSLASSYISQGKFNEALSILTKCRDELLQMGEPVSVIRVTIDMVDMLNWLGDFHKSLDELDKASELLELIAKKTGPKEINGSLLKAASETLLGDNFGKNILDSTKLARASMEVNYYRGLIYKSLHRYDDAESLFHQVLPAYEKLGVGAAIEFQFVAIALAVGENQKALDYSQKLESVFKKNVSLQPKLAALLKLQAEALHNQLFNEKALIQLDQAIHDLTQKYYDPDELWKLYQLKGHILSSTGNLQKALDEYIKSANIVNSLRRAPLGYRLDSTYLKDKYPLFFEAIELACSLKEGSECCNLMEMIKSRTLTATLSIPSTMAGTSQLKDKAHQLTTELEALEYKAFRGEISANEVRTRSVQLRDQRDQVIQQIRFSDPRWRNLTEPIPFDLNSISDLLLKKKFCAISLFYNADRIISVLIKEKECFISEVTVDDEVKQSFEVYLQNLNGREYHTNPLLFDPSESLSIGARHFIAPELLDRALKSEGLIIVPHGPLHLLPWSGLIYNGRRLFEYCPVGILPNLSCIPHLSTSSSKKPFIAIVGPPDYKNMPDFPRLPGAEKECKEILKLYPEGRVISKMVMGKNSTERSFWNLAGQAESKTAILHIACHGISEPEEPMHSGLILSDGRIDASEIALSSLHFEEVVLSACSTGWRPVKVGDVVLTGDDILGLPGAFLEAGTRSVLVSIPAVDDEAGSAFMISYHKLRADGKSPLKAMQLTQLFMSENTDFKPYQWVGITLYGCQ